METLNSIIGWLNANTGVLLVAIGGFAVAARAITSLTPSKSDDLIVDQITNALERVLGVDLDKDGDVAKSDSD